MKDTQPDRVRFGVFELDLTSGELHSANQKMVLQEQPLRILRLLVERDGDVVTREEIRKKLWPNDTIVEFDHSINTAIKNLRRALGDSAEAPKFIETIARRGYRFMAPVEWITGADDSVKQESSQSSPADDALRLQCDPAVLTGRTVSHYRVLGVIGGGGMGVVYRAEDLKLGRRVALKFLPEELGADPRAHERFSREARAVSSLDHPNICSIFEFGEHEGRPFIVMPLLEGQTLRDRLAAAEGQRALPLEELLDIGTQVCDGLQAAHDAGIIHRDIKPANIFLTSKGVAKVLDFGLVKLLAGGEEDVMAAPAEGPELAASSASAAAHLTRTGLAIGTAAYMSPEQARGDHLDARTDVFSFGLVLYEMATGRRAFAGETAAILHDALLHDRPVPVHKLNSMLPPKLEAIIDKAMEKDRERRYQSAAGLRADLAGLKAQPRNWFLKNGRLHQRRVVWCALTAVVLALLAISIPRIKNLINNRHVVGGTSSTAARDEYQKGMGYLARFDLSGNIDHAIESLTKATQLDPHYALAFAELGRAHWLKARTDSDSHEKELALSAVHESIRLAPNLAEAHVRLGGIESESGHIAEAAQEEWSALRIAPGNPEAYKVLGATYLVNGQYDQAEAAFREAVRLQPADWYGQLLLGWFYGERGRYTEARTAFAAALKLTPDNEIVIRSLAALDLREGKFRDASDMIARAMNFRPSGSTYLTLGSAYYYQRRYTEAAAAYNAGIQLNPGLYSAWGDLGEVYQHLSGNQQQAQEAFHKAIDLAEKHLAAVPLDYNAYANLAEYWAQLGHRKEALAEIDKIPQSSRPAYADRLVLVYELTGDRRKAIETVRALPPSSPLLNYINNHPDLESLRRDSALRQ